MSVYINNTQASIYAQGNLSSGQTALQQSVERLSSGLRVNRASDNASSLAISQKVQSQIGALAQGVRNASQAISVLQTAEGSLTSASDMLLRMKELAVQGRNDSLSAAQRSAISLEIAQLRKEINALAERTTFNSNFLLKSALVSTATGVPPGSVSALQDGAEVLSGLRVNNLKVDTADTGTYRLSFGDVTPVTNQISRITTALTGLEGSDSSQRAIVGGTSAAQTITLSGVFEAGDTIRYTVKGDNPDKTTVLTYTVTAENLTRNNDGSGGVITGGSAAALEHIAAGIAAQYNANNISKPDATASGSVITFSGVGLVSITVGAEAINRVDQAREVIITAGDLGEGNRVVLTINKKSYEYIVASDSSTEDVAEGLRQLVLADYPDTAVRAGSILTIESGSGLTVADIEYRVHTPADTTAVTNLGSIVSDAQSMSAAQRTIAINDFDVVAGRKFMVTVGNPEASSAFSIIAGTDDTKTTVASKLASRLQQNFGSGGSGVTSDSGTVTFGAALGLGMSAISLQVIETTRGPANTVVGPAQGITAATWGVGGRLDDGVYEILYSESGWSVVRDPVAGYTSTFNGSVLTTSPGNQVNVVLSGTLRFGDRFFFEIVNGNPTRTLSRDENAATADGSDGARGTSDDQVEPGIWNDTQLAAGAGTISGSNHVLTYNATTNYWTPASASTSYTYTATYNSGTSTVTVIDNPYRSITGSDFGLTFATNDQLSFNVGATGSPGTVTLSGTVQGSFSGRNTLSYAGSGPWRFDFNGSNWVRSDNGQSFASGASVLIGGVDVGTLSGGRKGDSIWVGLAYNSGTGYYYSYQSGSSHSVTSSFNNASTDPLLQGSYTFKRNSNGTWTAIGSTPASASYDGTNLINGSGARTTKTFQIRQAEPLDATTASASTRAAITGDTITVTNTSTDYLRVGTTGLRFAVAGRLDEGDYILEYNGFDYSIKNAYGDIVLSAQYVNQDGTNWLILDPAGGNSSDDDRVELDLAGTPQVGDKVYFTLTAGNVITNRLVNGSYLGGREDSVSSKFRDRSDRVISISDSDLVVGRSVAVDIAGKEYAVLVESTDNADSVAGKLAGLIDDDYPNTTVATQTPEFPAATRVSVSGNRITLGYPALTGIDDIQVSVRSVVNPGVATLSKLSATGAVEKSQAIQIGSIAAGGSKTLEFGDLGVSFDLQNLRNAEVTASTFTQSLSKLTELNISGLRSSALFQVGPSNRGGDVSLTGFTDIRLNGDNLSTGNRKTAFDGLAAQIEALTQKPALSVREHDFSTLENLVEGVITYVSASRAELGVQQNRLEHAISGTDELSIQLKDAKSRLVDTDMAQEMARLVRLQIGQQAAAAMVSQANLLPEVILSMLRSPTA